MFNELMTFDCVGIAPNITKYPLENPERGTLVEINYASSDNIGPICVKPDNWVGGNHSFKNELKLKTAETVEFIFYADSKILNDGDVYYAKTASVIVKNVLFDPRIVDYENEAPTVLCTEDVIYTISDGSVTVDCTHIYKKDVDVDKYYGMQSMFINEYMFTSFNDAYPYWTDISEVQNFRNNGDMFCFTERNSRYDFYQTTLLLPLGMGDHHLLAMDSPMFVRSSGKSYHNLYTNYHFEEGDSTNWKGIYSWNKPVAVGDDCFYIILECPFLQKRFCLINNMSDDCTSFYLSNKGYYKIEAKADNVELNLSLNNVQIIGRGVLLSEELSNFLSIRNININDQPTSNVFLLTGIIGGKMSKGIIIRNAKKIIKK